MTDSGCCRIARVATANRRRAPSPHARQRDADRTRQLLLDAAQAEFAAHGYAGARISAIAARAGVNQQLISYYFDGKDGIYRAISEQWQQRQQQLIPPGTPLPEQLRRYAMEAIDNPEGVRLLAWTGLEYTGPQDDPGFAYRARLFADSIEQIRTLQRAGQLAAELDPACLVMLLMSAAMAPTILPEIIEAVCGADARSPEFIAHFADQLMLVGRLIGLDRRPADA
jgi:AcrR family transcriptional regulator